MGLRGSVGAVGVVLCLLAVAAAGYAAPTELVSVSSSGVQADDESTSVAMSADGRFVAFDSLADNLVPDDTNGFFDVFVRDRVTGETELVSVGLFEESDGDSRFPSISADGRFVAFVSVADNLVVDDTNGQQDVFVWDRQDRVMTLVSVNVNGFSADGPSGEPSINADGRFVAFSSLADDLILGDVNLSEDVFLRDLHFDETFLVSVSDFGFLGNGASGQPSISDDGLRVAFTSLAANLVANDVNFLQDVFLRDLVGQFTEIVSISTQGVLANDISASPAISGDGRFVAFESFATDLVPDDRDLSEDIFVRDLDRGTTEEVTPVSSCGGVPCGDSFDASINRDGRFVSFTSLAPDLVPDDNNDSADVFVTDRDLGRIMRMSISSHGVEGDADSFRSSIDADGRIVAFISDADNLVPDDHNHAADAFTHEWITFSDVPPEFPAFLEIEATVLAGIVEGFEDGKFHPELTIDRAQMAVFIARAVAGGDANVPSGPSTPTFSDVPTDFWAFRHIEFIASKDIAEGFEDGTFRPDLEVDRAQMAVFLARAIAGGEAHVPSGPATPTFEDVPTDFWAFKHIEFVAQRGIMEAVEDDLFRPEEFITRDEMAVFIFRAFNLPELAARGDGGMEIVERP